MKKMHVKRGDTVKVIAGKDKGKEGKIILHSTHCQNLPPLEN